MARHRASGGEQPSPALQQALSSITPNARGARHRAPSPTVIRTRVITAALAAGTFVTGAANLETVKSAANEISPLGKTTDLAMTSTGIQPRSGHPETLPVADIAEPAGAAAKLGRAAQQQLEQAAKAASDQAAAARAAAEQAAREAAERDAREAAERERVAALRAQFVKPAEGVFTSGFGARWGTSHQGVDIANAIGTPIRSVADGVVVESGPASGFGLWVRIRHNDGTVTVYGHINESLVQAGQRVTAGQQIATMGNRGQSTGPHLHFEVWLNGSQKIDPRPWLAERGIQV
ncbi:peptidase [Longimycelium tulufanense]|uniref:Peptidase n=1 Tax=Longimycelium tulufanense TaxID=907463 RepID=A0A8J3FTY2_9PSEU|nr:M23 family metallopeptidase [Longimycelium tulufanense]GGM45396.1 peptidase [Longimycelium tulufanense]